MVPLRGPKISTRALGRIEVKPAITIKQYEQIYRIVSSAAAHFSHGPGRSCQFYNVNAAYILTEKLKIRAWPMMGAAFIRLNDAGDTMSFAGQEDGEFFSSPDAFHCWVETPDFILDFTAPEYKEACPEHIQNKGVPRLMFQRERVAMSASPESLLRPGDFFFSANIELTKSLLEKMLGSPACQDFFNICCDWYQKLSNKGIEESHIMNDLGEVTQVKLIKSRIISKW